VLLERVVSEAAERGFLMMMAVIGDSANASSVGLHHAVGFERIGLAKGIGRKFGRFLDVVYMQKSLKRVRQDELPEDLEGWLDQHGLGHLRESLALCEVDFHLVMTLSEEELRNEELGLEDADVVALIGARDAHRLRLDGMGGESDSSEVEEGVLDPNHQQRVDARAEHVQYG
jgi:hypothetical protein